MTYRGQQMDDFFENGWMMIPKAASIKSWVEAVAPSAMAAVQDPANAHWLRCGGTWFVGVNILDNAPDGTVDGAGPLPQPICDALRGLNLSSSALDRAQVSVIYPGYPQPSAQDSEAAFRFRRDKDAAHVDGLLPIGQTRQRMLKEPHSFVLGVPLTDVSTDASPLVVWTRSHHIMRRALGEALRPHAPAHWSNVDLTATYQSARREAFETCERKALHAPVGGAYLIHRLTLHGVAAWSQTATAPDLGRAIAYFRPELPGVSTDWITAP